MTVNGAAKTVVLGFSEALWAGLCGTGVTVVSFATAGEHPQVLTRIYTRSRAQQSAMIFP